jgi:nucleotide sugar dehydrogenase
MKICVVGLGKVGLPLAVQFASKGHQVVGADVNRDLVDLVNAGIEPFPGETDLASRLMEVVEAGLFSATTDTSSAVSTSDVVVVVVPLFIDSDGLPNFTSLDQATHSIAAGLRPGTLVSYETTLPVGTTRTRWAPMLAARSGLKLSRDFDVVFSPERVLTGRIFSDLTRYPKLVGGLDDKSARHGIDFYTAVLDFNQRDDLPQPNGVWDMGSAEAAELAKLAETTYRDVNIGLANQFARFAATVGIDIEKVISACNSQPYSHIHRPGIAVGGHCIPIYPRLYLWNDPDATVVRAAREVNSSMPAYAIELLGAAYGDLMDVPVLVLGAAYRGGVKETAFSGAFGLVDALRLKGAVPFVSDPLFSGDELRALGLPAHAGEPVRAAVIQTDHAEYRRLTPGDLPGVLVLLDGRRVTDPSAWTGVRRLVIGGE